MAVNWYSLFSHTGKETETVAKLCRRNAKLCDVLTNNMRYQGGLKQAQKMSGDDIHAWLMTPGNVRPESVVTLNGYMRILPKEVLDYLKGIGCGVYNIHPAPITIYPDLKGKDPQERLFEGIRSGKYAYIGAVIREVDEGIDTGKILLQCTMFPSVVFTKDYIYDTLAKIGVDLWCRFFKEEVYKVEKNN